MDLQTRQRASTPPPAPAPGLEEPDEIWEDDVYPEAVHESLIGEPRPAPELEQLVERLNFDTDYEVSFFQLMGLKRWVLIRSFRRDCSFLAR